MRCTKAWLVLAFLLAPISSVLADGILTPAAREAGSVSIQESDGSPAVNFVTNIKVSNGSLTNNGDGTVTLSTNGAAANVTVDSSSVTGGADGSLLYVKTGPVIGQVAITGLVKGNGTSAPAAATAGTDYVAPTGSTTFQIPNSTTLPATCSVGYVYMDTDATSGQRFYLCESTNTWVLQGNATIPFSGISSSTNTSATMTVGAGGSIVPTSTGVIAATAVRPILVTVDAGNNPYTALTTNSVLTCDTSLAARTINLPAVTGIIFWIYNVGPNTCTVSRNGTDTILGATSLTLTTSNEAVTITPVSASNWGVF